MSSEFEKKLDKYAEVIVKVGLNLQPGQRLMIGAGAPYFGRFGTPIEAAPLVRLIATKAYQAGARFVEVLWDDDQLKLIRFQNAPRDSFEEFPVWRTEAAIQAGNAGDAILIITADNPDLLTGQDQELVSAVQQLNFKHNRPIDDLIEANAMTWCMVPAPVNGWTEKVFQDIPTEDQVNRFWETIFEICRVDQDDPIAAWDTHIAQLKARSDYLNNKRYASLKFTAPGTDLTVGLPKGHIWGCAHVTNKQGIDFTANLPTEEIATMPHKERVEGVVTATKPLSFGGCLIEGFSLTFSEGRVVKATAKKGEDCLRRFLEMDEGAKRIGEVALVPHSSPISQSGRVFYNVLIDENASNHLALGSAYRGTIENGGEMSDDEFASAGGNWSQIHIDFMIGAGEMNVDGLRENGIAEAVMRSGEWAFEL
jgi:aminopeptidase